MLRKTSCALLIAVLAFVAPVAFAADEKVDEPSIVEQVIDFVLSLVDDDDPDDEFGSTIEPN
ncbi:MAG: hypothetical protein AAGC60_06585 [Acidobacteriota bacterium]